MPAILRAPSSVAPRRQSLQVTAAERLTRPEVLPTAKYERRRNCVGNARVRAPIVRFGARGVAGRAIFTAAEAGWPAGTRA
jgi:hypothetical protein